MGESPSRFLQVGNLLRSFPIPREYTMALLPYLDSKDASPEVQKLLTGRPVVLNVQRMTANAQKILYSAAA